MSHAFMRVVEVAPEVAAAVGAGSPVVAFESAVLSHGLPPDAARRLAARLDEIVRAHGVTPALVAVRDGRIIVGQDPHTLDMLLDSGTMKLAERDLAVAVARGISGGTTVSATAAVIAASRIRVMTTGGIGGVHLGAEESGDVSADLRALARYPCVVVCAGAKAICDHARTAEALDTLGVTVVGYRTDTFPAFYVRSSGVPIPHRADSLEEVASIARAKSAIGDGAALLVMAPIPESAALDAVVVEQAVASALARARAENIHGPALTPFLLSAIADATRGQSLRANVALLEANAALAAGIAAALAAASPPARN